MKSELDLAEDSERLAAIVLGVRDVVANADVAVDAAAENVSVLAKPFVVVDSVAVASVALVVVVVAAACASVVVETTAAAAVADAYEAGAGWWWSGNATCATIQ
jgi:hypothetical protein